MALAIIAMIIGLAVLVWSADLFIDGATDIAVKYNMPSFLIGVLILGVGTSAPELVVSGLSALAGSPGLALGNAYGSNIMNIALVLGVTAFISPIFIRGAVIKQDMLLLLAMTALAASQLVDGTLSRLDGIVLSIALLVVLIIQVVLALRQPATNEPVAAANAINITKAIFSLIIGLAMLILSSRAIVWGAVELATLWGISELIIGLTIVAVGTSLPELVASIVAARRGEHEMALGNIIGSNLFNTLGVVGLAAIIHPLAVDPEILSRDFLAMTVITILLFILAVIAYRRSGYLGKGGGGVLIASFIGYTGWLISSTL